MNQRLIRILFGTAIVAVAVLAFKISVELVRGSTVTVSASVTQTVTCSTNIASAALGTLSSAAISSTTGSNNASTSLSCNDGLGCALSVQDQGNGVSPGLATTSPAYLIPSANGTIVAGTEDYGIQASSTPSGSGGTLVVSSVYGSTTYAGLGGLLRAATTLASSTAAITNRAVLVSHWAAISATTQAGVYADTITYSCTGN